MSWLKTVRVSNSFLAACLVVIGFLVYMVSFPNKMFWDDDDFILHNVYVQDWSNVPKFFTENVIAGSGLMSDYWRPVLLGVFAIEWHAWGAWTPGWHMVNTVFHVANGILLFFILLRITYRYKYTNSQTPEDHRNKGMWLAFFIALLFLIHPVQVEAVAYVNSLGDSLSVFFMFVGLLCFQKAIMEGSSRRHIRWGWVILSVLTYPPALMSKETAIIMPGLLAFVYLCQGAPLTLYMRKLNFNFVARFFKIFWPYIVIAVTYIYLRATTLNFKNSFNLYDQQNAFTDSLWVRLLTFCKIIVEYIKLIFWPQDLHMERGLSFADSLWDAQVIIGACLIIGLLIIAWQSRKKYPLIAFGILWFFIALLPTSNIVVPINGLLYEHWLYVPIVGVGIALVGIWDCYKSYRTYRTTYIVLGLLVIIAFALSTRTVLRIRDWRDPITFYKQTIQYAPESYRINNNLGMVLADNGELEEAIFYYHKAIELDNTNPVAYYNLGNVYEVRHNYTQAVKYYSQSINLDEKFLYTYPKLINVYYRLKNYNQAMSTIDRYMKQIGEQKELVILRNKIEQEQLSLMLGFPVNGFR